MWPVGIGIITALLLMMLLRSKEGWRSMRKPVVLVGDSVFDNGQYVESGYAVVDWLKREYGSDAGAVSIVARDGARIRDVYAQLTRVKRSNVIILSIGGNDLLARYHHKRHPITDTMPLEKVWSQYTRLIDVLEKHVSPVFLVGLYRPHDFTYHRYGRLITQWNRNIQELCAQKKSLTYINLERVLVHSDDFVHSIEPSKKGGRRVAAALADALRLKA